MPHYVVICGGRQPTEETLEHVDATLDFLERFYGKELRILHGDAKGVDRRAKEFCEAHDIRVKAYPADWDGQGAAAGPIRNKKMAELLDAWLRQGHTGEVIAFDGGHGTENMCWQAGQFGLTLTRIPERVARQ